MLSIRIKPQLLLRIVFGITRHTFQRPHRVLSIEVSGSLNIVTANKLTFLEWFKKQGRYLEYVPLNYNHLEI